MAYVSLTNVTRCMRYLIGRNTGRSAWSKGVAQYACDLLDLLETDMRYGYISPAVLGNVAELEKVMLNGANDWKQYSEGGCALCYDHNIAERLCAPWELRKTDYGRKAPNPRENWIDVQSRALHQAFRMVVDARPNMIDFNEVEV